MKLVIHVGFTRLTGTVSFLCRLGVPVISVNVPHVACYSDQPRVSATVAVSVDQVTFAGCWVIFISYQVFTVN